MECGRAWASSESAQDFLCAGELGLGDEDQDLGALGIHAELETGEIVGTGESRLIGIDFKGHVVLLEQGDEAGGFGGFKGAELVEEGFCVGHGVGVALRFPGLEDVRAG